MSGIKIAGTGRCVPRRVVTNDELAQKMDTSDEWIASRTGIRRRHLCGETEGTAALCAEAARKALLSARVTPEQIGVCIVATITPDTIVPSMACTLQKALGLPEDIPCFDMNAACTGFLFALHTAECLLAVSERKFGLVVSGEALSRVVDWTDRSTCVLFGDGAGAAVVKSHENWPSISAVTGCRGNEKLLRLPGPGSREPMLLSMEGKEVFRFAVEASAACVAQLLEKQGMSVDDIDFFVFHQANARIIDFVVKKHRIPEEKCCKNIQEYGNTSAASIPLLLSELQESGKASSGSRVLAVAFGGGLTWGGAIIEFA